MLGVEDGEECEARIVKAKANNEGFTFRFTDTGNGERLVDGFGDQCRYVQGMNTWRFGPNWAGHRMMDASCRVLQSMCSKDSG